MSLITINLGSSCFFLDVVCDEVEEGFISSFSGQFRKNGVDTIYSKLYWQIVKVPFGVSRMGNLAYAFDVDGSTEPFTSLYDISRGIYREQVAKAMKVSPGDIYHDVLVLNCITSDDSEPVDEEVVALAIKKIEGIQNLDVGLTAYFTENFDTDSQIFISILLKSGFQKLIYDGFVDQNAALFFRPQSALLEEYF